MKYLVILIFVMTSKSFACDQFLGKMNCKEQDTSFDHTLSKIEDGYVLLAKSAEEEKELILTGQIFTRYSDGRKIRVNGTVSCRNDKLTLIANSTEESLIDPQNKMSSTLEITYERVDKNTVNFKYKSENTFTENGKNDFVKSGEGRCSKSTPL